MSKTFKLILTSLLVLAVASCGGATEDRVFKNHQQPIYNGSPPPADEPMYDAVVSLHYKGSNEIFCSGTLISDRVVLTAAHCLDDNYYSGPVVPTPPGDVTVYVGNGPTTVPGTGTFYAVEDVLVHPRYNKMSIKNDLALMRLVEPVSNVTPVPALPKSLGFKVADEGTLTMYYAGFGQTEDGTYDVKLQVSGPLGAIYSKSQVYYEMVMYDENGNVIVDENGDPVYYGPCFGDSGGPAFIKRSGTPYVGSLTSYGDADCHVYGVNTRMDAFQGWINDYIDADQPPPTTDCGDGVCGAGESCDGRNGTAKCSDCAGKPKGKPSTRYCFVEGVCEGPGCS
jgi:secreted trypsin-like serine protease